MKIYKYPFDVSDGVIITMPEGAHPLTVQVQRGFPCLWAIVDPDRPMKDYTFRIFGTGHEIDIEINSARYIGTFQLIDGNFIGHMFQVD